MEMVDRWSHVCVERSHRVCGDLNHVCVGLNHVCVDLNHDVYVHVFVSPWAEAAWELT